MIAAGLSSVAAYSAIVAWWLTAYTSSKTNIPLISAFLLGLGYLGLFSILAYYRLDWLHKDVSSMSAADLLGIGLIQAVAIASPIAFDWTIRQILLALRNRRN